MSLRILKSDLHPSILVDPFGQLPCDHEEVSVHITNGESMGDDLLECEVCGYVITLKDLYSVFQMPPGLMPGS